MNNIGRKPKANYTSFPYMDLWLLKLAAELEACSIPLEIKIMDMVIPGCYLCEKFAECRKWWDQVVSGRKNYKMSESEYLIHHLRFEELRGNGTIPNDYSAPHVTKAVSVADGK